MFSICSNDETEDSSSIPSPDRWLVWLGCRPVATLRVQPAGDGSNSLGCSFGEGRWLKMGHIWTREPIQNSVSRAFGIGRFLPFWIARKAEICILASRRATRLMVVTPGGVALASRRTESSGESSMLESDKESLNFKVKPQFKKEFKGFAVSEGISMTDLLKEGFALSKKKRQK